MPNKIIDGLKQAIRFARGDKSTAARVTVIANRRCDGCGARYHPSWNGPGEAHLCPDCSGAT